MYLSHLKPIILSQMHNSTKEALQKIEKQEKWKWMPISVNGRNAEVVVPLVVAGKMMLQIFKTALTVIRCFYIYIFFKFLFFVRCCVCAKQQMDPPIFSFFCWYVKAKMVAI